MSRLSQLEADVDRLLVECIREESKLPKHSKTDSITEVLGWIAAFCNDLRNAVSGKEPDGTLIQRNRKSYADFMIQIHKTAPDFRPFDKDEDFAKPSSPDTKSVGYTNDQTSSINTMDLTDVRDIIDR